MTTRSTRTAIWLRIFCAVLLLSLGFGHKQLYAAPLSNPASSFYVLPDGSFAGLCIGEADGGKPQKSWFGSGCDVCRLAGNVLLPVPPADHGRVAPDYRTVRVLPRAALVDATVRRPGSPVRGPPSFVA